MSILVAWLLIGAITMLGLLLDDAPGNRKYLRPWEAVFLLCFAAAMGPALTWLWWRDYISWCESEGLQP